MKKKHIIYILPITILVFSTIIPGLIAKRPPIDPEQGKYTLTFSVDSDITGTVYANGEESHRGLQLCANWIGGHIPDPLRPILTFSEKLGNFKGIHEGNDFELEIIFRKQDVSVYFAWSDGGKRYRLLMSGNYVTLGDYTITDIAYIYEMGRGKPKDPDEFPGVTISFTYGPGWP